MGIPLSRVSSKSGNRSIQVPVRIVFLEGIYRRKNGFLVSGITLSLV